MIWEAGKLGLVSEFLNNPAIWRTRVEHRVALLLLLLLLSFRWGYGLDADAGG